MIDLMPIDVAEEIMRLSTEGRPITLMIEETDDGKIIKYPYVMFELEKRFNLDYIRAAVSGVANVFFDLFPEEREKILSGSNDEEVVIIPPEAKANFMVHGFMEATGYEVIPLRKRIYGTPGEFIIECAPIYRKNRPTKYSADEVRDFKGKLIGLEDNISSGGTVIGCVKGFDDEKQGRIVIGFVSLYHRGEGLVDVGKEFAGTGKKFGGFCEYGTVPKNLKRLRDRLGHVAEDKIVDAFVDELYTRIPEKGGDWVYNELNKNLRSVVPSFHKFNYL